MHLRVTVDQIIDTFMDLPVTGDHRIPEFIHLHVTGNVLPLRTFHPLEFIEGARDELTGGDDKSRTQ